MRRSALALALASISLGSFGGLGCSSSVAPSPPTEPTEHQSTAIIHGVESTTDQDFVVLIGQGAGGGAYEYCSGALIAPNLVLTARHCVSTTGSSGCAKISADDAPGALQIYAGHTRSLDWITHAPDAYGKELFFDDGTNLCSHDLALIVLDTPLNNFPYASIRLDSPAVVGDKVTAIGWGVTDAIGDPGVRAQRTDIPIKKVDVAATEFLVGEAFCHGDSGGPGIDSVTGAIVGVVSRGGGGTTAPAGDPAAGCVGPTTQNIYTGVWGFKSIILKAFAAAGRTPWLEGQPDPSKRPFGDTCTFDKNCQSGVCLKQTIALEAGSTTTTTCSQACSDTAPCPTGYDCALAPTPDAGTDARADVVVDAASVDAGASANGPVCLKHVDVPPPPAAPAEEGKSGCSTSGAGSAGEGAGLGAGLFAIVAALGLFGRARRRAT